MRQLTRKIALRAALAFAFAFTFLVSGSGLALAQEFQKVEGAPRAEMAASPFVVGAYGFIWLAILVYVFFVARGLARVDKELGDLQRRLRSSAGPATGPDR
jgi:CcmD family protein